jgi:hypothetical protein
MDACDQDPVSPSFSAKPKTADAMLSRIHLSVWLDRGGPIRLPPARMRR